ncbi:hypothetical protein CEXT_51091 [Caerostris extrusa]|uniref:Uncharacterized protein n=1 Tax=Caerostris extrusa TaxID=172846 RepID=A0AAV4MUZ9_CAEEX|nr:hypothetical protein CEXT_51091 [Caerostris extrusa]
MPPIGRNWVHSCHHVKVSRIIMSSPSISWDRSAMSFRVSKLIPREKVKLSSSKVEELELPERPAFATEVNSTKFLKQFHNVFFTTESITFSLTVPLPLCFRAVFHHRGRGCTQSGGPPPAPSTCSRVACSMWEVLWDTRAPDSLPISWDASRR